MPGAFAVCRCVSAWQHYIATRTRCVGLYVLAGHTERGACGLPAFQIQTTPNSNPSQIALIANAVQVPFTPAAAHCIRRSGAGHVAGHVLCWPLCTPCAGHVLTMYPQMWCKMLDTEGVKEAASFSYQESKEVLCGSGSESGSSPAIAVLCGSGSSYYPAGASTCL